MKLKLTNKSILAAIMSAFLVITGCSDSKSYSELLTEEEHAVNWYLAKNKVETTIPADNKFIVGKDAPYYKMLNDGSVYMRVITAGDPNNRAEEGDRVYFSFVRCDIKALWQGASETWVGNSENLGSGGGTNFVIGDSSLPSSTQYGEGIQLPLDYLGLYSEVELVVKSTMGFSTDISNCIPYVYKIRYFPAEY